jgi:acetamidase/formamidase
MISNFHSLYTHDFIRIASWVPRTQVADVSANLSETMRLAREGDALKAAVMIFPELGLSAYAIDDLLFQDALLDGVERGIGQLVEASLELYPVLVVGAKAAHVAPGVVVPVDRPFSGVMGVAPTPAMGRISTSPPGVHTGNIDNKDLVAGTMLFMPVYAVGALFSVGDAHAAQGQGEVDLSAIETGNRGKFQFILRKDIRLTWPRAETPTHWIVMGLNPNLDEAMKIAVRETILFLTQRFPRLSREEAYMIASVAVDYHVTQVVDGTKGIHGMIPKSIFVGQ